MSTESTYHELPLPDHFQGDKVAQVWNIPYQERAKQAWNWADEHRIKPASSDHIRIALIAIDVQNSFCIPEFELFVGGRSGLGAVEDNRRLCEFIYRNLGTITQISATLDTHTAMQIFHPIFLIDAAGCNPPPMTLVSLDDIESGRWKFNPDIASSLGIEPAYGQEHLLHYARELRTKGKYDLTIWPYHVLQGSIGHALVASFEEALFFHTIARSSQVDFITKGDHQLTESYSALGPEVISDPSGHIIAQKNELIFQKVREFDVIIIAGQAKSHCVAWTIDDLLRDIQNYDESLAGKVYLLEDCTSPVVVPGVVDYSDQADQVFERFADAGMHVVRSTDPIKSWPDLPKWVQ